MTSSIYFPSPRDGLDEGSLSELALDCRDIELHVAQRRAWTHPTFGSAGSSGNSSGLGLIEVPDDVSALIDGFGAYGA